MKRELILLAALGCIGMALAEEVSSPMMTAFGEKVTSANCWREYPRPQMVRDNWTCLNGDWDYAISAITNQVTDPWSSAAEGLVAARGTIRVPYAIESPLSGVSRPLEPQEYLWYRRTITLDPKPGEHILLHFGAVDFRAVVYLGHHEAAIHDGGQLPFTVDLTDLAQKGENTLTVLVWDPTESFIQSRGKQSFATYSCFYTRVSGIWQTVWLETVPDNYIADYKVVADIQAGTVKVELEVEGREAEKTEITVFDAEGKKIGVMTPLSTSTSTLNLTDAHLWSPADPYLYQFTAKYGKDEVKGYFAMRSFEKRKDEKGVWRFFLNGKPTFILGTLDQGWWPDGLLTPPSDAAMVFDIQTLKECGYNMMRKHIKVEPLRYYYHCDRLGLLVLQDMPCSRTGNPPSRSDFNRDPWDWETVKGYGLYREELRGMMVLLQKTPSIVMWIPYNEAWGQHDRQLTHTTLDWVKRHDPTRLVNGPSGWADFEGGETVAPKGVKPWRVKTEHLPAEVCEAADAVDYHYYRGPAMPPLNDRRISFLGEFGGLGHPVEGHLWRPQTKNWGYGGMEDTKTREGLEKTYLGLMDKLADFAAQGLAGAVYTQTTDVEIEVNGLLTYDRKVLKYRPEVLKAAHDKVRAAILKEKGE